MSNWQNFGTEEDAPGWGTRLTRRLRVWSGLAYHWAGQAVHNIQRTQIKLVVRLAPLDVADAKQLGARLFEHEPKDIAEKQLRDAACTYLAKEANTRLEPDEWLTLAQVLRTLRQDYGQDVLSQLVHASLNRRKAAPAPAPRPAAPANMPAPAYQVQGLLGIPGTLDTFAYISMGLAVVVLFLGGWVWVAETRIDRLKLENREFKRYTKIVEEDAKKASARAIDAESRVGMANASVAETAKRAATVNQAEVKRQEAARGMRRREEAKRAAERSNNPDGVIHDPNDWLRDLAAQPLLSAPTIAAPDAPGSAGGGHSGGMPGDAGGAAGPNR